MADETAERERLRGMIRDMIKRAPDKVNNGHVHMARDFKKWYASAVKLLDNQRASLAQITSLYSQASGWYQ